MNKIYDRIIDIRGNLITVIAKGVKMGELGKIHRKSGHTTLASVLSIDGEKVTLQAFENPRGVSTGDKVSFLGHQMQTVANESLLGRRLNGSGEPIDEGPEVMGERIDIGKPSFNPVKRIVPHQMVNTNIPMIDVFNCLVKSQKSRFFLLQENLTINYSCGLQIKPMRTLSLLEEWGFAMMTIRLLLIMLKSLDPWKKRSCLFIKRLTLL